MHPIKPTRRRIFGVASIICSFVFVSLSFASLPAGAQTVPTAAVTACPVLSVGNPNPGDDVVPGGYVISGTAFDPAATAGSGIAKVDFFLGERDNGGTFLGSAVPGNAPSGNPQAFTVTVTVPAMNRGVNFAAYALSSVTGQWTAVTFPIFVGVPVVTNGAPTPTPIPTITTVTSSCPRGSAAASAPAAVAATAAPGTAASAPSTSTGINGACPVVSVGNPNPGDNLMPGGYVISGIAYDPAATAGSGIAKVDFFLGQRENGGTFLGSAVPGNAPGGNPRAFTVQVTVPAISRGVDFSVYALSSITGQQTAEMFSVFVGAPAQKIGAATPTPIPTTTTITTTCR